MTRDQAITMLRQHAQALRDRGVVRLALIGSLARDEACADSDVDLLVDIDQDRSFSLIDHSGLRLFLCDLLARNADVIIRDGLDAHHLSRVQRDSVVVF